MKTSDFNFELPQELIAQTPIPRRDASRLLVSALSMVREETETIGFASPEEFEEARRRIIYGD